MATSLQTAPRIFISHSHKNNDFGLALVQDLRQALGDDNAVWYDAKGGLHGGDNWWTRIKEEIKARSVFIVILSPDALDSPWVRDEIDLAWYLKNNTPEGKQIIPLLYRQCVVPDDLALRHVVSFLPPLEYEEAFNELLTALGLPVGMETKGALGKPDDAAEALVQQMTPQIHAAFEQTRWSDVIQKANLLIQQVPTAVPYDIYYMQGVAYLRLNSYEFADDALNSALALVSDSEARLKSLYEHVQVLSYLGRWKEVLQHASEAVGLAPTDPYWQTLQNEALSKLAEMGEAPSKSVLLSAIRPTPALMVSFTYRDHTSWVHDVTWSPDSKYIASASSDRTVHVWEWEGTSGKRLFTYKGHSRRVNAVSWLPDINGDEETLIDNNQVQEWSDGMWIASAGNDRTVQVWHATTGEQCTIYRGHKDWVNAITWSPDRTKIASASNDKTVQVWDAASGTPLITYRNHTHWVNAVAWSPDGKYIASASSDKTVQVWDAQTGRHILTYNGHTQGVYSVLWSPRGVSIASGSKDKTVQIWNPTTGDHGLTYSEHSFPVLSLARSPHGRRMASASEKNVHVWYGATGDNIIINSQHKDCIRAIAWSPNGRYLASASDDKTVQVRSVAAE
ncbi:MAG: TIR domain-containing protein [Ktedonobacteraceae bacterium]|nr:TIR domain-containing protein [Ktedonobacteraceae bacterium]